MTTVPQSTLSNHVQRIAAELSARLAQLATDPPDLATYFRLHAECVLQALQPVGLAYEMVSGPNLQRAFAYNHESLGLREAPAQELAFQRAVLSVLESGQPLFLDANTAPTNAPNGLRAEDAPAPEALALYNQTPFQQIFVPIVTNQKAVGVLHAWFIAADPATAHARAALLAHAAAEIGGYLRARRTTDLAHELTRITTYARFLEDVAGDQDLDDVAWKLVNYAREAVNCDRVCLLTDSRYGRGAFSTLPGAEEFELQACSGLRRPHQRSEHAEVLTSHASELLKLATSVPAGETAAPTEPAGDNRPRMRIVFTQRDPSKVAARPDAVNRYFDIIPMNWSTVLPLYDRENRVCGTLLFEGQQSTEKVAPLFLQMRDLAVSGGRALSTALIWHRRRTLRSARSLMRWRDSLVGSSRRRLALKYGLPALLVAGLMATPFPFRISGDATLRPVNLQTVAALTTGRLMEINAREGDHVKKGQILCVLDSADLQSELRQAEQDRERYQTEEAQASQLRSDAKAKLARLNAEKAQMIVEKFQHDIELTVIKAPFDGVIAGPQDFAQRKGQVIRVGETVAEVVDPAHWEVKVSVREQDVPTLRDQVERNPPAGVPGTLVLTANPNHVYPLQLKDNNAFSHRLDTANGKYNFSAILPLHEGITDPTQIGPGNDMKTGYTGHVRFSCGKRPLVRILFGDFIRFLKVNIF